MIKPPAMGVFARDDPPPSHRSQPPHLPHAPTPVAPSGKQEAETIESQQEEDGQDDDQGTVDEEAGIIRCICSCDEDDGFTIQCDRCLVWQHCACFGMSQASVPDEYLCEQCAPRPVDVAFAVAHQQKRKNNEARKALMDRNLKKQAQALVSASYTQDYLAKEAASSTMLSPSSMLSQIPPDSSLRDEQTSLPASVSYSNNRLRKPSQALDLSNTQFVVPDVPASAGSNGRVPAGAAKQRKGQKGSRRGPETPTAATTPSKGTFTPGSSNERYEDPFDLAEQLEAWHVEFTPISKNVVADPAIIHSLAAAMLDWEDGSPLKAHSTPSGRVVAPVSSRLQRSLLKLHDAMDEDDISPPREESPADESAVTLSAIGNECVPVEMQGPSLADLAARTYVRHISETASAGVFSNVVHATNTAEEPQPGWCASKAFSRPVMHGLFADSPIAAGTFVSEFRGELYGADSYRSNPINQFAALGATKSHVHLFPPPLNLAIDARRFGNEARFARFSCHPNAVLRPILFRRSAVRSHVSSRAPSPLPFAARHSADPTTAPESNASDEPELLFGIFAISDIPRTHEVTLGWEWDDAHIVHFLPELVRNPCMLSAKTFDPDVHTANMVALAERGDFPYAYTEFSTKMRTVAAALLGSVLCSCIGSAAPPGGGGGASTNNGRKQDCAVAQMLRVGNGMSLLNVPMPGKSNRRARLPDFTPLVGIRRHWRVLEIPPTPDVSVKDHGSGSSVLDSEERTQAVLASNADRRRLFSYGYEDFSCGATGSSSGSRFKRSKHASKLVGTTQGDHSQDDDDARSVASSLTDPLSGLSYDDNSSDEEDIDLTRALRLADGLGSRPISVAGSRTSQQDPDHSGLFLLPPKKRSLRTRIKALRSPSDDGNDDGSLDESETLRSDSRRSSGTSVKIAVLPTKQSGTKRKTARIPSRLSMNFDSDDEDQMRNAAMLKKRRKSSNIADPSSPLSSVPSPETDRSSLSPRPGPRLSSKHRSESERRLSDLELSKQKRAARRGKDRGSKVSSKTSTIKTKKRKDIRSHRQSLLGMADSETSDESNDSHPVGLSMNLGDGSKTKAVGRTDRDMAGPSNEDTLTKVKKSRRVLSDSDSSLHEDGDAGTRSTHQSTSQVKTETDTQIDAAGAAISLDLAGPDSKIVPALDAELSAPTAIARATREADINIPEIEVKKEEPRVKLSLAEYKRRLAERRVSEQQRQETSLSASAGTPPSELDGSEKLTTQSQDLLRPPPATGAPLHPVESPVSPQPSSVATVKQAPTSAVEPSRSFLFTSTSAPTAIRSVEIPKSPSPEPQRPTAEAASSSQQAAATPAGRIGVTDSASASGDLHIRNSPSSIAAQPSAPPANSVGPLSAASLSDTSSRPPPSPSAAAAFNPPKAPRSYMAGVPVSPPSATGSATYMAPPGSSIPDPGTSFAGATASSANAAMPRYPGGNMTSPSPTSAFTPGPSPRDFAGVPKGPASMRDQDQVPPPVRDAWAEAREQREFANRVVGADHGYRDPREAAWAERERMRWEREASHRPERDPRDSRSASRDDRELAAAAQAARLDYHHQQYPQPHPYRRPSMNDYEDHIPPAGMSYDRPADPYGRGMMGQPRDGREMRDYRDIHDYRDPRDYDLDLGGGAPHPNQHAYAPRGGYRGGWGGGGRSRGRGTGRGGRGGGWMR